MPEPSTHQRREPEPIHPLRLTAEGGPTPGGDPSPDFRRRLRDRDREALERFYELYFDRVYGYVRRMLSEEHLAEDVTQDIFMHIQRSIHTYDPSRALGPWVFTIATNKVRDFWRSRRHKDTLRESSLDEDGPPFDPPAGDRGPLPRLENEELGRVLSKAIDELPASMRETLVLRYFEGLPFEEIGRQVGHNETAIRKRYSRALEALREALGKYVSAKGASPA